MKYDLKMIYFTLNGVETKSERVETVPNRLETGFPNRISHQSRKVVVESIKPPEPRGVALQMCHVAQPEGDACAAVSSQGASYRVVRTGFLVAVAGLS